MEYSEHNPKYCPMFPMGCPTYRLVGCHDTKLFILCHMILRIRLVLSTMVL